MIQVCLISVQHTEMSSLISVKLLQNPCRFAHSKWYLSYLTELHYFIVFLELHKKNI